MKSKPRVNPETSVWVLGAGGHAKVTADIIRALNFTLTGLIDQRTEMLHVQVEPGGGEVLMTQDDFFVHLAATHSLPEGASYAVVAIGHNAVRLRLSEDLGALLAPALIDPRALISPSARIGDGSTVLPGVIVNASARIGRAAILNTGCIIEHDCTLADGVHISPGATLCGNVSVGARSWIGSGSTVIPGVTIGEDVVVGAGSTVIRDVPSGTKVVGVPARHIGHTRPG